MSIKTYYIYPLHKQIHDTSHLCKYTHKHTNISNRHEGTVKHITHTQRAIKSHTTQTSLETFISQDEWIMGCLSIYKAANETWAPWNLIVGIIILPLGCQGVKLGHSFLELLGFPAALWSWSWLGMCSVVDGFPSGSHGSAGQFLKGWPPSHRVSLVAAVVSSVRIAVLLKLSPGWWFITFQSCRNCIMMQNNDKPFW